MPELPLTPTTRARLAALKDCGWDADITFDSDQPTEARVGLMREGTDLAVAAVSIPMLALQSSEGANRLDQAIKGMALACNVELPPDDHENLRRYLETTVAHWRKERDAQKARLDSGETAEHLGDDDPKLRHCMALCYVDAYQSVASSMLGELIP